MILNDSLGGLQFGIDENGNYGYIKAGADTVTPFSNLSNLELVNSVESGYIYRPDKKTLSLTLDAGTYYIVTDCLHTGNNTNKPRPFRTPTIAFNVDVTTVVESIFYKVDLHDKQRSQKRMVFG